MNENTILLVEFVEGSRIKFTINDAYYHAAAQGIANWMAKDDDFRIAMLVAMEKAGICERISAKFDFRANERND